MKSLNIPSDPHNFHMSLENMLEREFHANQRTLVNFAADTSASPLEWQMQFSYNNQIFVNKTRFSHTQDFYEIIVHLRSSRRFMSDGHIFDAGYGDCLLFAPGERHMGIEAQPSLYERYYILINPALLPLLPDGEVIRRLFDERSVPRVISLEPKKRDEMLQKLERYQNSRDLDASGMMGLRITILELLHTLYLRRESSAAVLSDTPPLLSEILHHIHTDFAVIESATAIADRFGISPSYLSRLFRQNLLASPYQYLMSVRLDESRRLLESGASVTDACFASGFSDCSHFIAYFRRSMGITPSEIKKKRR